MKPVRVAIFASGNGSNAVALIQKAQSLSQIEIVFVLSDKAEAPVLQKAAALGIATQLVEKPKKIDFADISAHLNRSDSASDIKNPRLLHEQKILNILRDHQIDWVCLAGYMRLLSPHFLHQFADWHSGASQVVNIHPSLLPDYPGVDSIARAHADRVSFGGVTLHLVDEGMDTGKVLYQEKVPLGPWESLEDFTRKIHAQEHQLYGRFLEDLNSNQKPTCHFKIRETK